MPEAEQCRKVAGQIGLEKLIPAESGKYDCDLVPCFVVFKIWWSKNNSLLQPFYLLLLGCWGGTDCDGLVVVMAALEQFYVVNCITFKQKRHV